MKHRIEGPTPLTIKATATGAEIGLASFLKLVFLELFEDADGDPSSFAEEFADMHSLSQAAQRGGVDCHARHEFDERLDQMIDRYADEGTVKVPSCGVTQLAAVVREIAAPRPVPGQRGAA
ncbi:MULTISPECIES: hypothetical protein [Streptomyces]|uniref:Uncharacterized protein n=2 Tax=Streptomyces TaxID=1883 RepID=A0A0W7X672_9ACTN|nr:MULTISPECIES: hypothetical protein [Streptomyces]KUF18412.1 hypothetical protein AT728_18865 [Streptomyces silvensis]MVO84132.1 hypothetical protein [Streptomyces typhae]